MSTCQTKPSTHLYLIKLKAKRLIGLHVSHYPWDSSGPRSTSGSQAFSHAQLLESREVESPIESNNSKSALMGKEKVNIQSSGMSSFPYAGDRLWELLGALVVIMVIKTFLVLQRFCQIIAQIRTVLAYVGESRALQAYSAALKISQRLGYKSGFSKGLGLGATYFTVFCCYALLLWYDRCLVRQHYTNGGLAIATMFSVMIGGLALGQSAPSMPAFAKARVAAAKNFRIIDHKSSVDRNCESGFGIGLRFGTS